MHFIALTQFINAKVIHTAVGCGTRSDENIGAQTSSPSPSLESGSHGSVQAALLKLLSRSKMILLLFRTILYIKWGNSTLMIIDFIQLIIYTNYKYLIIIKK